MHCRQISVLGILNINLFFYINGQMVDSYTWCAANSAHDVLLLALRPRFWKRKMWCEESHFPMTNKLSLINKNKNKNKTCVRSFYGYQKIQTKIKLMSLIFCRKCLSSIRSPIIIRMDQPDIIFYRFYQN